jgi:hypothetical protein
MASALLLCIGCQKMDKQVTERQKMLDDRAEITRYDAAILLMKKQRNQWITAMEEVNRQQTPIAVSEITQEKLLPALSEYLLALKGVPTQHQRLAAIHGSLVSAYKVLLVQYQSFSKQLTPKTYVALREPLVAALSQFNAAQGRYRRELDKFYKSLGVKLRERHGQSQAGQALEH